MEAKNMILNNQQIMEEIKKEIKICIETNENERLEKGISCNWRPKESRTSNTHVR